MNTKFFMFVGLATGLALQLCPSAMANSITATGSATPNQVIPDNNLAGLSSQITLTSLAAQSLTSISSVTVTVDVTGNPNAWDGDYYAYLEYNGTLVVLLNHLDQATVYTPYGSPGNGFAITFSDAAGTPALPANANTTAPVTGTFMPVGNLAAFNDPQPSVAVQGPWTLFLADESAGGVGVLTSWSVAVTGLPDTGGTLLLLTMGVGLLGLYSMRQPPAIRACLQTARGSSMF